MSAIHIAHRSNKHSLRVVKLSIAKMLSTRLEQTDISRLFAGLSVTPNFTPVASFCKTTRMDDMRRCHLERYIDNTPKKNLSIQSQNGNVFTDMIITIEAAGPTNHGQLM